MKIPARPGTTVGAIRALAMQPALLRLVAATVLRWGGLSMAMVAYLVVAYAASGAAGVALLGAARMVPATIVAPFAGSLSARVGHERLLVAAYVARIAFVGLASLTVALGMPVALMYGCAAASAAVGALVRPLHAGMLPAVAQTPDELVAANVASSSGEGFATLVGPALGGVLVVTVGAAATLGAATLVAFGAAVLAGSARATSHERRRRDLTPGSRLSLTTAVDALRCRPGALLIVLGFGAQTFVRGLLTTLIVVASIELLGLGNGGVGALNAALGAGALAGAIASVGQIAQNRLRAAFVAALAWWGLPIAFIGVWPAPLVAFAALALVGLSNALLDVAGFTLLQRTIPAAQKVTVLGLLEGVIGLGVAAGSLASPVLIGSLGAPQALVVTGLILPIVAVAVWPRLARDAGLAVVPEQQLNVLRSVSLFAPLPLTVLEDLARSARPVQFAAGELLMREGEPGDRFLVLTAGAAEVSQSDRVVRTCGPGDGVGEIALLRRMARTATVRATAPTSAYALDMDAFVSAVTGHAVASAAADSLVGERLGPTAA